MLRLGESQWLEMVGHVFDALPNEGCGLLVGELATAKVDAFVPCRNADASARTYSIGVECWDRAQGDVIGVVHSHTHTEAYPSPTDVEKADNPLLAGWHYVIISLKDGEPVLRSFRIDRGQVSEEPVVLERR